MKNILIEVSFSTNEKMSEKSTEMLTKLYHVVEEHTKCSLS